MRKLCLYRNYESVPCLTLRTATGRTDHTPKDELEEKEISSSCVVAKIVEGN